MKIPQTKVTATKDVPVTTKHDIILLEPITLGADAAILICKSNAPKGFYMVTNVNDFVIRMKYELLVNYIHSDGIFEVVIKNLAPNHPTALRLESGAVLGKLVSLQGV